VSFWLYREESKLHFNDGTYLLSRQGVRQGCALAGLIFCIVMHFVARWAKKKNEERRARGEPTWERQSFFFDDVRVYGETRGVHAWYQDVSSLTNHPVFPTNLFLKPSKSVVCCSRPANVVLAKELFPEGITVSASMNGKYLRVPIGDPEFVKGVLEKKRAEMKEVLGLVGGMTEYPHILRVCLSQCKILHLLHTVPPKLMRDFVKVVRKIVGTKTRF